MLQLPDGRKVSKISVYPKNWKQTSASAKEDWYINYRIYEPGKPPAQFIKKGMNEFKTVQERRAFTEAYIKNLQAELLGENEPTEQELTRSMPFIEALKLARQNLKYEHKVLIDVDSVITGVAKAAKALKFTEIPICEVGRKNIKMVLDHQFLINKRFSTKRFNSYRTYLSSLFKVLIELEATDTNPVRDVTKMKVIRKLRSLPTIEEIQRIDEHIKSKSYEFWRYMNIFFYSGARTTELFRLKKEDVHLKEQEFVITVIKGKNCSEGVRGISDKVLPLWSELLKEAKPGQYLFSKNLKPGDKMIRPDQIGRRWNNFVKRKVEKGGLNIQKDFYSLKHLYAEAVSTSFDIKHASVVDGHTNTNTTSTFYAIGEKRRILKKVNSANIDFVQKQA